MSERDEHENDVCVECVELGYMPYSPDIHNTTAECKKLSGKACASPHEHHRPEWRKRHNVRTACVDCGQEVDYFDYEECRPCAHVPERVNVNGVELTQCTLCGDNLYDECTPRPLWMRPDFRGYQGL